MKKATLKKLQTIIKKGVSHSSFGDAAEYQRKIRQDRKLPFRNASIECQINMTSKNSMNSI